MKIEFLWKFSPIQAYLLSTFVSFSTIIAILLMDTRAQSITTSLFVSIAGILMFVFLTELPSGKWYQRLSIEILHLFASFLLFILALSLLTPLMSAEITMMMRPILPLMSGLAGVSHIAVRLFARPSAQWAKMRRRRLLWEITHAQLRLVLLTMFILFMIFIGTNLTNEAFFSMSAPAIVSNMLTLLIATGGLFGIVTGILLFIVMIPASLLSYLTARRITYRLRSLIAVTQDIGKQNLDARVSVEGEDEIAQLQNDFNTMMDILAESRQELETERDTVRQLLSSRQGLFADVSHELRTPVATIRSYLEGLNPAPENQDDIEIIRREVLRLQRLIDDVFTLARADIQELGYNIKPLEIGNLLEHSVIVLQQQAWQSKKVDIVLDYLPQIPLVMADEQRLEQVIYNLIRNAIRHTPPGGLIRVTVASDETTVTISVEDTGDGISSEDLPHIWERFYRSKETRASDSTGSGLGLALVKEMIEVMSAQVGVKTEIGKGSCFTVRLNRVQ